MTKPIPSTGERLPVIGIGTARPDYLVDNLGAGRGPMPDAKTRERMADLIANG